MLHRVLVVGHRGMLGRAWCQLLQRQAIAHSGMDIDELDVTDPTQVAAISGYDAIINCTGWTNVDGAEDHEAEATKLNGDAVGYLAARAKTIGAALIHYSTDYVFDGQAASPYTVDHERDPINAYGRSKAVGELQVQVADCDHLLIRTSWLYAPWGNNFVLTMLKLTKEKDTLKVVNDQRGRPTSAQHLAAVSLQLLQQGESGIFHVTDGGQCTWYEFTRKIAELAGHTCDIQPCTSDQFPRPAKRPAYSVLDLSRTEAVVGPMPDWAVNLKSVLDGITGLTGSTG